MRLPETQESYAEIPSPGLWACLHAWLQTSADWGAGSEALDDP